VDLPHWRDIVQIAFYLTAIAAAAYSARTYYRNSAQERAQWLFEMYQRFYDAPGYRDIRMRIERGQTQFAQEEKDEELLQRLDDYLNFFEFISFLVKEKRLHRQEAMAMFDYPLRQLARDNSISRYLTRPEYGYEGLNELLKNLRYPA
jgi:hypothetical protein